MFILGTPKNACPTGISKPKASTITNTYWFKIAIYIDAALFFVGDDFADLNVKVFAVLEVYLIYGANRFDVDFGLF